MDRESCHASGMYVDEHMFEAGKNSIICGKRKVWGWPVKWPYERLQLVKRQSRKVDEMPLEQLWFCGADRPAHVARFFRDGGHGRAQLAALQKHVDAGVPDAESGLTPPSALRESYARELGRRAAFWGGLDHSDAARARAVELIRRAIRDLDEDLVSWKVGDSKPTKNGGEPEPQGPWLGGDKLSIADAYWHVACARLVGLGLGDMLRAHDAVSRYADRVLHHERLKNATFLWLGTRPFPLPRHEWLVRVHKGRLGAERHRLAVLRATRDRARPRETVAALARYVARGSLGTLAPGRDAIAFDVTSTRRRDDRTLGSESDALCVQTLGPCTFRPIRGGRYRDRGPQSGQKTTDLPPRLALALAVLVLFWGGARLRGADDDDRPPAPAL